MLKYLKALWAAVVEFLEAMLPLPPSEAALANVGSANESYPLRG